jgi:hypothetical protein
MPLVYMEFSPLMDSEDPYHKCSSLPILYSIDGLQCYLISNSESPPEPSENLTASQKLLLRWHYHLPHLNFQKLQDLTWPDKVNCQRRFWAEHHPCVTVAHIEEHPLQQMKLVTLILVIFIRWTDYPLIR